MTPRSPEHGGYRPGLPPDEPGGGGRFGGLTRAFSRLFENPDNPLGWSLKVFTAWKIDVRVHLATILFVVFMLLWSIPTAHAGIEFMTISMASLLLIVLLHEFGHCFACRAVGGEADRIVMLPIGGLALVRPRDDWRSNFITTAGGPLVNVALVPLCVVALSLAGLADHILFNPLDPIGVIRDPAFQASNTAAAYAKVALWWFHYLNLIILAFNVLIPAYPLDGGRLLQAALWSKIGYQRATEITCTLGLVAAMTLAVFGLVFNQSMVVVIAVFAGWSCWVERKRLRSPDELADMGHSLGAASRPTEDAEIAREERLEAKRRHAQQREQEELDRILEKISQSGMDALTRAERRTLHDATERRRKGS